MTDRRRSRGLSVRIQLTLSYAIFLVLAGIALFVVGFLILRFIPDGNLMDAGGGFVPRRSDLVDVFVRYSAIVLVGLAVVGLGGGWILAGHMLKPVTRITAAARSARDGSLGHRINMPGRQNELAELADTFDDMLERVQKSTDQYRRFAANASHELRTPLAVMRTMLEVARADPRQQGSRSLVDRLSHTNERSIALIEALLALAEVEHHDRPRTPVALDTLVNEEIAELARATEQRGLSVELDLTGDVVSADAMLLRLLISNLVMNAIIHNHEGGVVWVTIRRTPGGTSLEVANTGTLLEQEVVDTFAEPFVRGARRTRPPGDLTTGPGLGLAIVSSIAAVNDAPLTFMARDGGGLRVSVLFTA